MMRRLSLPLLSFILLQACNTAQEPLFHDQYLAFGTVIEVTFYGVDRDHAEQVSAELERQFLDWHRAWHAWEPGPLTETNAQLATLKPFTADPALLPLLAEANRLSRLSNHLFNPTIGKLIRLWGFQGNPLPEGTRPDPAEIEAWLQQAPTVDDIAIEGTQISSRNPQAAYDLGAFAKGYAIDRVVEYLRRNGIHDAIVNTGGDLRAIGTRGDRPWRIGIRHPRGNGILARIRTSGDASVFTSGDYERLFEVEGVRYHHILDPRSGYPASAASAVTVVHADAATADAAATALFIAGADEWRTIARSMGVDRVLRVDREGVIHLTPAMHEIIELDSTLDAEVRIAD